MSQNDTKSSDSATSTGAASSRGTRYAVIALVAVALFAVSYGIAAARSGSSASAGNVASAGEAAASGLGAVPASSGSGSGGSGSPGCACCGGGGSSTPIEGTAALEGDVQRISVDLSSGSYNPNTIKLKAGVPAEVTFGQGSGCTAQVQSQDLNFFEDLTSGPKTINLPALQPGEYQFSCGMQMVFGKFVVE